MSRRYGSERLAAAGVALLLGAASCGALLGIDDVTVESGTTGAGGQGGTGGAAEGPGGTGGEPAGPGGAGGEAQGHGGSGGAPAGSGGSGGSTQGPGGSGGGCGDTQVDPQNCGDCGHDCLGGDCAGGKCLPVVLNDGSGQLWGIAVDETRVYWVDNAGDLLLSASKADGTDSLIVGTGLSGIETPQAITVDGAGIYFTNSYGAGNKHGAFYCPLQGSCASPVKLSSTAFKPTDIHVEGSYAYWLDSLGNKIRRADKTTGAGEIVLTSTQTNGSDSDFAQLTMDADHVYWTSPINGTIQSCAKAGSAPSVVLPGLSRPGPIVADGGTIFWANRGFDVGEGSINSMAPDGSGAFTLTIQQTFPTDLAVDATDVYWTNGTEGGALMRCPRSGCGASPEVLIPDLDGPLALALDDKAVYVTTAGDGRVLKIAK